MNTGLFGRPSHLDSPGYLGRAEAPGVVENIESALMSARQMEIALIQERRRSAALQEEANQSRSEADRVVRDLRTKLENSATRESELRAAVSRFQEQEKIFREKLNSLSQESRKTLEELQQYKNNWAGVLQREREARMIIQDSQRATARTGELEKQLKVISDSAESERRTRDQLERHAKSYQQELQSALLRLHSAESKFSELSKEFAVLRQSKKSVEEEVARIEKSLRERFEWESIRERERMRTEFEKESAVLLDKQRVEIEARFKAEVDPELRREMNRRDLIEAGLEREIKRLLGERDGLISTSQSEVHQAKALARKAVAEAEAASARASELEAQRDAARSQIESLQACLNEKQREITESSKQMRDQEMAALERNRSVEETISKIEREAEVRIQLAERAMNDRRVAERSRLARRLAAVRKSRSIRVDSSSAPEEIYRKALEVEAERSRSLEIALISEKDRFDGMTQELRAEVERLRSVYPLKDLLVVKNDEIAKLSGEVGAMKEGSLLRGKAEAALALHRSQKIRLEELIAASERRMVEHERRIERYRDTRTLEAEIDPTATC